MSWPTRSSEEGCAATECLHFWIVARGAPGALTRKPTVLAPRGYLRLLLCGPHVSRPIEVPSRSGLGRCRRRDGCGFSDRRLWRRVQVDQHDDFYTCHEDQEQGQAQARRP